MTGATCPPGKSGHRIVKSGLYIPEIVDTRPIHPRKREARSHSRAWRAENEETCSAGKRPMDHSLILREVGAFGVGCPLLPPVTSHKPRLRHSDPPESRASFQNDEVGKRPRAFLSPTVGRLVKLCR